MKNNSIDIIRNNDTYLSALVMVDNVLYEIDGAKDMFDESISFTLSKCDKYDTVVFRHNGKTVSPTDKIMFTEYEGYWIPESRDWSIMSDQTIVDKINFLLRQERIYCQVKTKAEIHREYGQYILRNKGTLDKQKEERERKLAEKRRK